MITFKPNLSVLQEPQRQLWDELVGVPPHLCCVGGRLWHCIWAIVFRLNLIYCQASASVTLAWPVNVI